MGQVADPGPILVADAAGDEALDGAGRVDDADCGVLRLDEVSHPVGDQLQHAIDVQFAADATDRLVERDQLVRCSMSLGANSGRQEAALQGVRHRRGLFGISADPRRADRLRHTGHAQRDLRSGRSTAEVDVQLGQRRRVHPHAPHLEAHQPRDPVQRLRHAFLPLARGIRLPGVDRLEQRRQDEVTRVGRLAGRGGWVGRLHRRQGYRVLSVTLGRCAHAGIGRLTDEFSRSREVS